MTASQLNATLNALSERREFDSYWHVRVVATGEEVSRGGDKVLPSASVRKVSVMMAALNAAAEGRLDLEELVTIKADQQPGILSGVCQYMTPGLTFPMRDAILQMIITSDNICTYEVMKGLEIADFTHYCHRIGMTGTTHRTRLPPTGLSPEHALEHVTTTTARDQVLLFGLILAGAKGDAAAVDLLGVSAEHCAMALRFLTWQRFRSMIPGHLPTMAVVANKTGWGERGWMDAGIVFKDDKPLYILSLTTDQVPRVMPDGLPGRVASTALMAELSRACWDALG